MQQKKVGKERKKEILEKIKKAANEKYKTEWDEKGNIKKQKKKSKIKKGKKSRAKGAKFELHVRKDLENKNWLVDKWTNNVDLEQKKVVPAKRKFNPFNRILTIGTGFPDFICFQKMNNYYKIIGVESKSNGILSKEEKQKAVFLLNQKIFNEIWIAKKTKNSSKTNPIIEYINFTEKYKKLFSQKN